MAEIIFREIRFNEIKQEINLYFADGEKVDYVIGCSLPCGITPESVAKRFRGLADLFEREAVRIRNRPPTPSPGVTLSVGTVGEEQEGMEKH